MSPWYTSPVFVVPVIWILFLSGISPGPPNPGPGAAASTTPISTK